LTEEDLNIDLNMKLLVPAEYIKHAGTVDDNLLFWYAGTFSSSTPAYYSFYTVCVLLMIIPNGLKLIVFDFTKKEVRGLFDDGSQKAEQLTVDHIMDDTSHKIRVNRQNRILCDRQK
jgi:hypothetical protein